VFLTDGVSIHDRLGLYFTLIALQDIDAGPIKAAAVQVGIPLHVLKLGRPDLRNLYERDLLLVRPDQHIAWRGDALPNDLAALLKSVVGR
jgi:hypothetical protein